MCAYFITHLWIKVHLHPKKMVNGYATSVVAKAKLKSGGWTNIFNHLRNCIGLNYKAEYQALEPNTNRLISSYVVLRLNDAEQDMFHWI
jgi:hypothetical protein